MTQRSPNIILINCDDLGYGDLGCYGGQELHDTPHLDRMAAEGMRFTDFYMASPVCSPSRAAMLTGCYPRRIGFDRFRKPGSEERIGYVLFPGDPEGLNPDEETIATLLKERGYATALVGKWHCGDQPEFLPTRHGFDSYYGIPYSNDMGRQVGRKRAVPLPLVRDEEVIEQQPDQVGLTERYMEEAVRFMRSNREKPFFLYLAHMYVHLPIYVQERFLRESRNGAYGGGVACVDWVAGVLRAELEQLGIAQNTLVLFTSDNGSRTQGDGSNLPLQGGKFTTWEGGQRLPLIAWWPGTVPAGTTCDDIVSSIDLLPTLARLTGARLPEKAIDGKDFSPVLQGEDGAAAQRESFFYYMGDRLEAVRVGDWKLFFAHREERCCELYNLREDIGETVNRYEDEPEVVRDLTAHAERMRQELGDALTDAPGCSCRPAGRVSDPQTLCVFDENYPYYMAEYDLSDAG